MSAQRDSERAYEAAGVDYTALDESKRQALTAALATSGLLATHGGRAVDASRGETAFVFEFAGRTLAFVLEGLGTKGMIARAAEDQLGPRVYADVAYDTVAAIVNDLCCVGAMPLVVNAYFATGASDWYQQQGRQAALVTGWQEACVDAGATWGGGESPSLPELVDPHELELAGSAIGAVPKGHSAILGADLTAGDEIVLVASNGIHANGSSLARLVAADLLEEGFQTLLAGSNRSFAQALLERSAMYVPLVSALLDAAVPVHYLSHITGHGLLKLMRPRREFTYRITKVPPVPEVLEFIAGHLGMPPPVAYRTFNMGAGFAVYCAAGSGDQVVELAKSLRLDASVAGRVEAGRRQVIIDEHEIVYSSDDLDLAPAPRRAA